MPIDIKFLHDGVGTLYHYHGTVIGKDFMEANKRILGIKNKTG
jgi:hypothetical protein